MTSLADELDMDPAFNDLSLNHNGAGGVPMSMEGEEGGDGGGAEDDDLHAGTSTSSSPPARLPASKRNGGFARRGRAMASDMSDEEVGAGGAGEGFSLADELGGGGGGGGRGGGASLADEVNGGLSIDEDFTRAQAEPLQSIRPAQELDEEARARRDREHYLVSSEILSDSVRRTDAFLSKLRKVADSAAANALPSRASSNSIAAGQSTDDTALIENTAAGIVRQLREHAQLREGQVRELQECDRILRRAFEEGGEYLMALAEIEGSEHEEAVEVLPEERDPLGITAAADMLDRRRHSRQDSMLSSDADSQHDLDPEQSAMLAASPTRTRAGLADSVAETSMGDGKDRSTAFQDLIKLQLSTSDLIGSLSIIHEHSQIAHASMGDATRMIRNIRNVLSNWQSEVKVVEQSQLWIASWEADGAKLGAGHASAGRPNDIREWTQGQLDKFERILDEAHVKAHELLKPVKDPVLDRLATSKA